MEAMNSISKERPIPSTEIARAEVMLTPEQRIMTRVRDNILAPLDYINLPENQKKIIRDYSDKAGENARQEFERLQKESPVRRILDALEELALTPEFRENVQVIGDAVKNVRSRVEEWEGVVVVQNLLGIKGKTKTLDEVLADKERIAPEIDFYLDDLPRIGDQRTRAKAAFMTERLLKKLGFLPGEVTLSLLFALPNKCVVWCGRKKTEKAMERLRRSGEPTNIGNAIIGLHSDSIPGVEVELIMYESVQLYIFFEPEAIKRSVAKIPAVT